MSAADAKPKLPVLVFTDLDGTLLDHGDYSYSAAEPALARLRKLQIPIIPNTSKTLAELAELEVLHRAMDPYPCIVENGSALCIPRGYFQPREDMLLMYGYEIVRLAPDYASLLDVLHRLRREAGYRFRGFHDMSVQEVAADTGLSVADAARARQRLCSEPLVWEGSMEAFRKFEAALAEVGFSLTRGGRYWHVMAGQGKDQAMLQLQSLHEEASGIPYITIALGDSPNDQAMLCAAEIAVVVRRPDGTHLDSRKAKRVLYTHGTGPAGWNESMQELIDELGATGNSSLNRITAEADSTGMT